MEQDERDFIRIAAKRLEEWERTPRKLDGIYSDMTREEVIRLAMYQREMLEARERELADLHAKLDGMIEQQRVTNDSLARLARMLADRDSEIKALTERNREAEALTAALTERLRHGDKERFGSRSQKGSSSAKARKDERSRRKDKDDFDGTPGSIRHVSHRDLDVPDDGPLGHGISQYILQKNHRGGTRLLAPHAADHRDLR